MGCPLRCLWCHNPESLSFCKDDGKDEWPLPKLIAELEKDRVFYDDSGGGVTLSGGEPLAQDMSYIVPLMEALHEQGISVIIDTCGDVPFEHFLAVLPFTDMFLYDLKLFDSDLHNKLTGVTNKTILENLVRLGKENAKICLRMPLLGGINDSLKDMEALAAWLKINEVRPSFISLLPYHTYGREKYAELGLQTPETFQTPSKEHLNILKSFWEKAGCHAGIGGSIYDVR